MTHDVTFGEPEVETATLPRVRRVKVLISAYACRPNWGSEPEVGWNWVREVSRFAKVHVITRSQNREPLFKELAKTPLPNVEWVFVPTYPWMRETNRLQYYLWQQRVIPIARELHKREQFDLAHHVTYCVHWLPSALAQIGVPFVWGPVGGGEKAGPELARSLSMRGRAKHTFRHVVQRTFEWDPRLRATARKSSVALATTRYTAQRLTHLGARDVRVLPSVSLSSEDYESLASLPIRTEKPRRLISIGRLLHWKGFDLGVEAFARVAAEFPDVEYWIVGDGSERTRLERLARSVDLQQKITFLGFREREQAMRDLASCDILVHPSMHDSGGWVTLEAMAAGRPVICLDAGGPAMQVNNGENGFKIAPGPRGEIVEGLADAMRTLLASTSTRVAMGTAARSFVYENYHSATGRRIRAIYDDVLGHSAHSSNGAEHPVGS